MAGKKSPSSLERKKLREGRARASALAAQSSVKELEEAEYYRKDYAVGCGTNRTYPTYNYDLQFQDGYEIDLEDLDKYCMGRKQYNELYRLVAPYFRD